MRMSKHHTTWLLSLVCLLAAALRIVNLDAVGYGNLYYAATVESMTQSWTNFFFVALEPGGSLMADKPPLAFWVQTGFALVLGVNGLAVILPSIFFGILSVAVLYVLVRRTFCRAAGVIAAFVFAVTPINVAADRSNNVDTLLLFVLLLATWLFVKATESARLRPLLLGGLMVGIAFNVKMLQAFLPLPALYGLYFLGAKRGLPQKIAHLALTTVVMVSVSLVWVLAVDLTPADQRPMVIESENNTMMGLVLGHNGFDRVVGDSVRTHHTGPRGVFRLFREPLVNEIGWLLPFGLFSTALLLFSQRVRFPLNKTHRAVVLWGGWLLSQTVFFSYSGFFHSYYLVMLSPALAALVGMGVVQLWRWSERRPLWASGLLMAAAAGTLAFQIYAARVFVPSAAHSLPALLAFAAGVVVLLLSIKRPSCRFTGLGFACAFFAMSFLPTLWAGLTTATSVANALSPRAYDAEDVPSYMRGDLKVNEGLLAYLQQASADDEYLMAVPSSIQGSSYVIGSSRPVLYVGGFLGHDNTIGLDGLVQRIEAGELRYVLWAVGGDHGQFGGGTTTGTWLNQNCGIIFDVDLRGVDMSMVGGHGAILFLCG